MRIIFLGTPGYSVPVLSSLFDAGHDLAAVITRPDKPAGRGRAVESPATAVWAREHGVSVLQPASLKPPEVVAQFAALKPDVMVVASYGRILTPEILAVPTHGCLNVHPSLLPKYRGSSPIAEAMLQGDTVTGVTIMLLDEGMDTGPIVAQEEYPVLSDDTSESLTIRMFERGAELISRTLPAWVNGGLKAAPQDDNLATYSRRLEKSDGELDFSRTAKQLDDQIRALHPWPGAYTRWKGKTIKVLKALPLSADVANPGDLTGVTPGKVVTIHEHDAASLGIVTGDGLLGIVELQLEGRKASDGKAFLSGHADFLGAQLPS
jgi:methionyl-tRNA formyltransferase